MTERGDYLSVGTVRRPHGVRGELLIALETDRPRSVFRAGRTLVLGDASGRPVGRTVTVEKARPQTDGMIVKLAEFGQRDEALERLRGSSLLIPAEAAAPADADEVPYHELIGMLVCAGEREVGQVTDLMEIGGGEILVVRRERGREALVPFVKEIVRSIDRPARRIEIDPPEGLLEL